MPLPWLQIRQGNGPFAGRQDADSPSASRPPLAKAISRGTIARPSSAVGRMPLARSSSCCAKTWRSKRSMRLVISARTASKAGLAARAARSAACAAASVKAAFPGHVRRRRPGRRRCATKICAGRQADLAAHRAGLAADREDLRGAARLGEIMRAFDDHGMLSSGSGSARHGPARRGASGGSSTRQRACGFRAAGMEMAAGRVDRAGSASRRRAAAGGSSRDRLGHGGDQRLRVGMRRAVEDRRLRRRSRRCGRDTSPRRGG